MAKMDRALLKELTDIVKVQLDGKHVLVVSDEKDGKREKAAFTFFGTKDYDQRITLADQYNQGRRVEGVYTVKLSSKKETRKGVAFYLTLDNNQTEEYQETIREWAELRAKMTPQERSAGVILG